MHPAARFSRILCLRLSPALCLSRLVERVALRKSRVVTALRVCRPLLIFPCLFLHRVCLAGDRSRFEYARPGPSEVYPRGEEYSIGPHAYSSRAAPQYPPPPHPPGGAAASFEEGGFGRHGMPPPPPPPHPGTGPHAAAFQVTCRLPALASCALAFCYVRFGGERLTALAAAAVCVFGRVHAFLSPHVVLAVEP